MNMDITQNPRQVKADFDKYIGRFFLKNLTTILSISAVVLIYYLVSDWFVRQNPTAAATRVVPLVLILVLLTIHLVSAKKMFRLKNMLYLSIYVAIQLMMYGKCLIHLHQDALAASVAGTILVTFLVSLDIKQKRSIAVLIYALPVSIFTLLLVVWGKPSSKELMVLADIYPIAVIGFLVNQVQYRLRYKLYMSNRLLKLEQKRTKALYAETLQINDQLEMRATEALLIKEEIQQKNEELNISNATKDRFFGIIAHDLKNPIGAIWGLSDILVADKNMDEAQRTLCIETINTSVKHTYELLENLLSWAKAQNKAIVYEPALLDAREVIENELKVLRQIADEKSITIDNAISFEVRVYADPKMFETIVRNLVSNAIKFSHAGSSIRLKARIAEHGGSAVTEISVRDNGIGMSPEKLGSLFNATKNISSRGTANEEGTGLGLLLCKDFVNRMNGRMSIESQIDLGTTVTVTLPGNATAPAKAKSPLLSFPEKD